MQRTAPRPLNAARASTFRAAAHGDVRGGIPLMNRLRGFGPAAGAVLEGELAWSERRASCQSCSARDLRITDEGL